MIWLENGFFCVLLRRDTLKSHLAPAFGDEEKWDDLSDLDKGVYVEALKVVLIIVGASIRNEADHDVVIWCPKRRKQP
jgi:hypothetical protein